MSLKLMYWSVTILFCFFLGLAFEQPAHAYTDPGSALLLFQSLGAVVSGVLFYFRRGLKRLITRGQGTPEDLASPAAITRADS